MTDLNDWYIYNDIKFLLSLYLLMLSENLNKHGNTACRAQIDIDIICNKNIYHYIRCSKKKSINFAWN